MVVLGGDSLLYSVRLFVLCSKDYESDEERYEQLREVVQYPNENIPVATKASQFSPGSFVGLDVSMPSTKTLQ